MEAWRTIKAVRQISLRSDGRELRADRPVRQPTALGRGSRRSSRQIFELTSPLGRTRQGQSKRQQEARACTNTRAGLLAPERVVKPSGAEMGSRAELTRTRASSTGLPPVRSGWVHTHLVLRHRMNQKRATQMRRSRGNASAQLHQRAHLPAWSSGQPRPRPASALLLARPSERSYRATDCDTVNSPSKTAPSEHDVLALGIRVCCFSSSSDLGRRLARRRS